MRLAVIGIDGCLGTRLIEAIQLGEGPSVAAVAADPAQLTRAARFAVDLRVADPLDAGSIARACAGCSAAVHLPPLESADLKRRVTAFCRGTAAAGVRRAVYVGSADAHGFAPSSGTDERTALHPRHASPYINALVVAERQFFADARDLGLVGVALRPTMIYGPRADMFARVAAELREERAALVNKGDGICNCVYVDNVVNAILLALKPRIGTGSTFIVNDEETITWREFYHAVAHELLASVLAIRTIEEATPPLEGSNPPRVVPAREAPAAPSDPIARQHCSWKFPTTRLTKELGLQHFVPFAEGLRRGAAWWRFAHADFSAAA